MAKSKKKSGATKGKLRIGDDWNAITIIALSQTNPLKAIAEFVENSIDARAKTISIVRGKLKNQPYLKIVDDGEGVPRNKDGLPDFQYVATHICDSIKRKLKEEGQAGLQGEFGIGLLSFWTVGETLKLTCPGNDGRMYRMSMEKGSQAYVVSKRNVLFEERGTELVIHPLLPGLRQINGEKIQRYLAAELRDRIRKSGVRISITDRIARTYHDVEPRKFDGRLLQDLPVVDGTKGEIYLELYLNDPGAGNKVGLYRSGTRVLESIAELARFEKDPWTSGYIQGIIDVPFLNLSPGTRDGLILDSLYESFCLSVEPLEHRLLEILGEQRAAEEEQAGRKILQSVRRAFREAFLALPQEEYDWFELFPQELTEKPGTSGGEDPGETPLPVADNSRKNEKMENGESSEETEADLVQKEFFEFPGPLHSARISPQSAVVSVGKTKSFRALCRARDGKTVEDNLLFEWEVLEGAGRLDAQDKEIISFTAPTDPGLCKLRLLVLQGERQCEAEALITITDSLVPQSSSRMGSRKGMPGYTFQHCPGELWRSRYDAEQNIIVVNNGHRDFVFAAKQRMRKLRYICRLFCKELVINNFPGAQSSQLLERLIELSLYTEDNLR